MTQEEIVLGNVLSKVGLNVCLMATAYGVKCLGPANPFHLEWLKRYAKLARKRGQEVEKANLEVRLVPMRYAFAQEVTLYWHEAAASEASGTGGWTFAPHWRRGHWRSKASGAGRQERRRVAIPSVLVNGHLFMGAVANAVARYRVRSG